MSCRPRTISIILLIRFIVMHLLHCYNRDNNKFIIQSDRRRFLYFYISSSFCADLSAKQLENNTDICEQLLRLADVLEPGITRFRGLLLYYLVRGLRQLKRMKHRRVGFLSYFISHV